MNNILIADKLSQEAEKIFLANNISCDIKTGLSEEDIISIVQNYSGIVVRSATKITENIISAGKNLKVLGRAGIGVDNIDVKKATEKGIVVMNTPYGNSITTAEHTISLMMSLARNIPQANSSTHQKKWEKSKFMGTELYNKKVGMIGCGNIGSIVVERCLGLKMKVNVYDPFLSETEVSKIGASKISFEELLLSSDFITLHTPLTNETKNILNKENLLKCKKGVRIINCARGGLIEEEALIEFITSGHVGGAALDVFVDEPPTNNRLFGHENLILTPHLGASTSEAQENVAIQIAQQISDYLNHDVISNSINVSPISLEEAPKLKPFLDLCLKLGKLGGQVTEENIKKINIIFKGEVSLLNTKPLVSTLLSGIFSNKMESVNIINAVNVAKNKNIDVITSFQDKAENYTSEVFVEVISESSCFEYAGTYFAEKPRIISIKKMKVEAEISSNMLYISNNDKPGFIGSLGTLLGDKNINIAFFSLGRTGQGDAISIIELDQPITEELITLLEKLENVKKVKKLVF